MSKSNSAQYWIEHRGKQRETVKEKEEWTNTNSQKEVENWQSNCWYANFVLGSIGFECLLCWFNCSLRCAFSTPGRSHRHMKSIALVEMAERTRNQAQKMNRRQHSIQKLNVYTLSVWKCVYESEKKEFRFENLPRKKKKHNKNTGTGTLTTILSDKIFDEHLNCGEHELICIHFTSEVLT